MGYSTDFTGTLKFNKPVTEELKEYISRFSGTRRMARNVDKLKEIYPNWKDLCFNGELGEEGEYFAPQSDDFGQEKERSIIDYNRPPKSQPSLWCQWIINEEGELTWDGGEKFYYYIEWLEYFIKNFFAPEGYLLSGEIEWQGEDFGDTGTICVKNNEITII